MSFVVNFVDLRIFVVSLVANIVEGICSKSLNWPSKRTRYSVSAAATKLTTRRRYALPRQAKFATKLTTKAQTGSIAKPGRLSLTTAFVGQASKYHRTGK